jgi:hypothetical protein
MTSPPPTTVSSIPGTLFCAPGTYTMFYTNAINGCTASATALVPLNVTPPTTMTVADATLCSTPTVNISSGTVPTPFYTYSWTGPGGATISSPTGFSTVVNMVGTYTVLIINTMNGCTTFNYIKVVACTGINTINSLQEKITLSPNPNNGHFNLKMDTDLADAELLIYNALGQKVYSGKVSKGDNHIDVSFFTLGIYNYVIHGNEVKNYKGKLIME